MNTINKTFLVKLINLMKVNGYTSKAINTGLNKLSKKASVLNKLGWYIAADKLKRWINAPIESDFTPFKPWAIGNSKLPFLSWSTLPGVNCPAGHPCHITESGSGACCIGNECSTTPNESSCNALGGTWQGENTLCSQTTCGESSRGACCCTEEAPWLNGICNAEYDCTCHLSSSQTDCEGGWDELLPCQWKGYGTSCGHNQEVCYNRHHCCCCEAGTGDSFCHNVPLYVSDVDEYCGSVYGVCCIGGARHGLCPQPQSDACDHLECGWAADCTNCFVPNECVGHETLHQTFEYLQLPDGRCEWIECSREDGCPYPLCTNGT